MILALLVVESKCEAVSDSTDSLECFCLVGTVLALNYRSAAVGICSAM